MLLVSVDLVCNPNGLVSKIFSQSFSPSVYLYVLEILLGPRCTEKRDFQVNVGQLGNMFESRNP